jgi:hypothetical protein
MKDLTLIIENVRTFRGRHEIPIRPLTILTGENSSGKTTLLAMFSAVCDQQSYPLRPDFNRTPYSLGNYETVASYKPDSELHRRHFSLGFRKPNSDSERIGDAKATYVSQRGQIRLGSFHAQGAGFQFSMVVKRGTTDRLDGVANVRIEDRTLEVPFSNLDTGAAPIARLFRLVMDATFQRRTGKSQDYEFLRAALDLSANLSRLAPASVISLAPTRSQPQRVYSQISEGFKPTGDHVPFVLDQILGDEAESSNRESLFQVLKLFGEQSGMFGDLRVHRFASGPSAPFELQVEIAGAQVNLVDVGYGVSQALPVLVEASRGPSDRFLLLQQPEIHLHPRAQAALGTLFVQLAAKNHRNMMVETHSDYLIDRVRQEVAAGKIRHDMVALLYLHREGLESKCHLIELDGLGNLINPPDGYRSFFLEETRRLLGRGGRH